MQFLLTLQKKNDHTVFNLAGDLNYEGACKLKNTFNEVLAGGEVHFVLDLTGLKIISSYALSTILKLSYMAKKMDGSVNIICGQGNVWDVFYVLEVGKVIPVFESIEAFLASKSNAGTSSQ